MKSFSNLLLCLCLLMVLAFEVTLSSAQVAKSHPTSSSTSFQTPKNGTARGMRSGFGGDYGMWNPGGAQKFDVLSLLPTLLIVGLGIMLLPVIISCLTQIVTPLNFTHGRKKRAAGILGQEGLLLHLMQTFQRAVEKYNP